MAFPSTLAITAVVLLLLFVVSAAGTVGGSEMMSFGQKPAAATSLIGIGFEPKMMPSCSGALCGNKPAGYCNDVFEMFNIICGPCTLGRCTELEPESESVSDSGLDSETESELGSESVSDSGSDSETESESSDEEGVPEVVES